MAQRDARKNAKPGSNSPPDLQLWRELVKKYPKDTEARIFLAQRTGGKEWLATLQSILKDDPENSAANHFYIHALEASDHPEQALHSAEILAAWRRPPDTWCTCRDISFFALGDYARAEQAFAASKEVDERYMREQHVKPDNDWNYVHNLMYAIANLMEEGKLQRPQRSR